MANHMTEVAKILGVELGEEFEINGISGDYKFNEDGLYHKRKDWFGCNDTLVGLLVGNLTIKCKPWKPKNGETYWCVATHGTVGPNKWKNVWMDIVYYKLGNCYRTEEEAEANKDKWIKFYASDEVLEV